MDTVFFKTLYAYNDWANMQVLETASMLGEAEYRRDFGLAWGSVHGTLAHLLAADHLWFARWNGTSPQSRPVGAEYATLADIRADWTPFMAERRSYIEGLTGDDLVRVIDYKTTQGEASSQPLWWGLYQVVSHGTDHRSHLSIMLTELGHPTVPLDFIAFVRLKNG